MDFLTSNSRYINIKTHYKSLKAMNNKNEQLCMQIEDLYTSSIYPDCPKKELCDNESNSISKKPKMPYIGREYGNSSNVPNLLFVSLDSGDEQENYHTIEEVRSRVELRSPRDINGSDKVKHWYQTFDIAAIILDTYIDEQIKAERGVAFVDNFISHTNSAKCTQNKENKKEADYILFNNCRPFVVKEIPLFDADVIISQGAYARKVLEEFQVVNEVLLKSTHKDKDVSLPLRVREINNKKTIHIAMHHPSYYKGYWGQKQALEDNLDVIHNLIQEMKQV